MPILFKLLETPFSSYIIKGFVNSIGDKMGSKQEIFQSKVGSFGDELLNRMVSISIGQFKVFKTQTHKT